MVIGEESRYITDDERTWSGPFQTAHDWAAGETTDVNPTGTGSATWRGIRETMALCSKFSPSVTGRSQPVR